jgi:hypothetical protein
METSIKNDNCPKQIQDLTFIMDTKHHFNAHAITLQFHPGYENVQAMPSLYMYDVIHDHSHTHCRNEVGKHSVTSSITAKVHSH